MKAFHIDRYGTDVAGRISDLPDPAARGNDVLVKVHAASVNVLDYKILRGDFKRILPYKFPLILGNDLAGVVVAVGPEVRRFKVGDNVYGYPGRDRIGTFAELISVREDSLALKPGNVDMEQAASVPLVGLTAWQVLVDVAQIRKGQKVLIHAGSGGVGTFAIQLAKHLGAIVAATTSTGNIDLVKSLGADIVIDYKTQHFENELSDYDVVLHTLGRDILEKSLQVLKPGGHLISISGPPDPEFARQRNLPWLARQLVRLMSHGIRRQARKRDIRYAFVFVQPNGTQLETISTAIESGTVKPVIDRSFGFDAVADALRYIEKGRSRGKVTIKIQ
ncbi:NADP-dependent oxidoreductase [Burkholderia sp. Ac-20384]|uniref:NADP-dependent oxidoreductase n=1 Tax=Burkholderia sp. Ac-20384 TaxID=2703902 RepID=UPI00197F4914|nr:NADP-dependent oxidoreductase [Burkholderia sp. Ac-20384]MBN3823784.1 NADP-dependent oxidoreductase [Burkholderia sp. Ac-20384]